MPETVKPNPFIAVISTGGTIAMVPGQEPGAVPVLTATDLISAVPRLAEFKLRAQSFSQVPSAHLTFAQIEELAETIRSSVDDGATGVVVTQGTDTIEEVAFCLDLLLDLPLPVIITGAMRGPSLEGADGPANLLASVRTASSPGAVGLGVLVVLNDQIHAARYVKKQHTSFPSAFASPLMGPVGWIAEGKVIVSARLPALPARFSPSSQSKEARVALLSLGLDHDTALLSMVSQAGYGGVVVEALGGGHCNEAVADALEELAVKMPVIVASRTGVGQMLGETYGFKGSEMDLRRRGVQSSGWLDAAKARIVMTLALRRGYDTAQTLSLFCAYKE